MEPPEYIDGAKVLCWACSRSHHFGLVSEESGINSAKIFGLAIGKYETVQDGLYNTIENAIKQLPDQYKNVEANWQQKENNM